MKSSLKNHRKHYSDIMFMKSNKKHVRCTAVFFTKTETGDRDEHISEIFAIEIIDFKLTGKMFYIYIKPRNDLLKNYDGNDKYYQDTALQITNFLDFIGNSYLVTYEADTNYYFLKEELNFWKIYNSLDIKKFKSIDIILKNHFASSKGKNKNWENYFEQFDISMNEKYHKNDCMSNAIKIAKKLIIFHDIFINSTNKNIIFIEKNQRN